MQRPKRLETKAAQCTVQRFLLELLVETIGKIQVEEFSRASVGRVPSIQLRTLRVYEFRAPKMGSHSTPQWDDHAAIRT